MKTIAKLLCGAAFAAVAIAPASAKDLNKVGISVGLLGNPFFVATIKGIEDKTKALDAKAKVNAGSSDYDLNKQFTQIDNFIASGVDPTPSNQVRIHAAPSPGTNHRRPPHRTPNTDQT